MVISLGKFRMVDFGDLTWNKEHDLACPKNLVGTIDLYVVSHHGQDISSLPMMVQAMHPRVAVMDNGAKKGGAVATFETLKNSPGLQDLWQLHYAVDRRGPHSPRTIYWQPGGWRHIRDRRPGRRTGEYHQGGGPGQRQFHRHQHTHGNHKDYGPHD